MADKPAKEPETPADKADKEPQQPQHSTARYDNYAQPEKPIRNWTKIFTIFIIAVLVLGAGAGAYEYLKNRKSTPVATNPQPAAATKVTTATKHYDSPNFYLGFDHPANWALVDNGGGVMTVTSPKMQLKNAAGEEVSGTIVMTIRNKSQKLPEFTAGNAVAAIASLKIAYSKPTQTQRGNTYISFLRYASTTNSKGLDGIYITGDTGYTLDQAIPAADFVPVDPVIDITFMDSAGKPLTVAAATWSDTSFSDPLKTMLESLSIT